MLAVVAVVVIGVVVEVDTDPLGRLAQAEKTIEPTISSRYVMPTAFIVTSAYCSAGETIHPSAAACPGERFKLRPVVPMDSHGTEDPGCVRTAHALGRPRGTGVG